METVLRTVGLIMTKSMVLRRLWMTAGWFGKNIAAVGIGMGISDLQNTFGWLIIVLPAVRNCERLGAIVDFRIESG